MPNESLQRINSKNYEHTQFGRIHRGCLADSLVGRFRRSSIDADLNQLHAKFQYDQQRPAAGLVGSDQRDGDQPGPVRNFPDRRQKLGRYHGLIWQLRRLDQ